MALEGEGISSRVLTWCNVEDRSKLHVKWLSKGWRLKHSQPLSIQLIIASWYTQDWSMQMYCLGTYNLLSCADGFRKVTNPEKASLAKAQSNEPVEFWHTNFRRGHPELISLVQRRVRLRGVCLCVCLCVREWEGEKKKEGREGRKKEERWEKEGTNKNCKFRHWQILVVLDTAARFHCVTTSLYPSSFLFFSSLISRWQAELVWRKRTHSYQRWWTTSTRWRAARRTLPTSLIAWNGESATLRLYVWGGIN